MFAESHPHMWLAVLYVVVIIDERDYETIVTMDTETDTTTA